MVRPHITLTMSVAHRLYIVFVLEIVYFVGRRVSLHLFPWSSFEAEAIDSAMRLITASACWYLFRSLIASGTVNQSALRSPLLAVGLLSFMCIPVLVGHYALSPPVAWMFAATSFFVAIKEEFLFRGIVQNLLTQRLGPSKAILSTSVDFTLSHVGVPEFTLALGLLADIRCQRYSRNCLHLRRQHICCCRNSCRIRCNFFVYAIDRPASTPKILAFCLCLPRCCLCCVGRGPARGRASALPRASGELPFATYA
jgi:membrane protease YdiL (CAAX protease family)